MGDAVKVFEPDGTPKEKGKEGNRRKLLQHHSNSMLREDEKELINKSLENMDKLEVPKDAVSGLVDAKGDTVSKPIKFTDARKKDNLEDKAELMKNSAVEEFKKEMEEDKAKGLDINDIESIKAFDIGYCPLGSELVCKQIIEEHKIGSIHVPPGSDAAPTKVIVIETGMHVGYVEKGDVLLLNGGRLHAFTIQFKGIKFKLIDYSAVNGVMKPKSEILARVKANKSQD